MWFRERQDAAKEMAARMLARGYVPRIVEIRTGLTHKQLRSVYEYLREQKIDYESTRKSRMVRGGATLQISAQQKAHASLLMVMYIDLAGKGGLSSVDYPSLEAAHDSYMNACMELEKVIPGTLRMAFSISDAWSLVRDMGATDARMVPCDDCGRLYYEHSGQTTVCGCPYCYVSPRKSAAPTDTMRMSTVKASKA